MKNDNLKILVFSPLGHVIKDSLPLYMIRIMQEYDPEEIILYFGPRVRS